MRVTPIAPKPAPTATTPVVSNPAMTPPPASSTHVNISLASIAGSLPEALRHKVPVSPDQFVAVPIERILPQLTEGHVVFTAAELRECCPESFNALVGHDDVPMTLPLAEIVKQLSTQHFARRPQRRIEVPQDVVPIFTGSGNSISIAKPAAAQPAPAYRAQPSVTTTTAQTPPAAAPASRISVSPQALAAMKAATSVPAAERAATATPRAMTPAPAAPAPAPAPRASSPAPAKKSFPVAPKPAGDLPIPLSYVCKEWVQEVRTQLADVDIEQHQILVPLDLLEPAMKSGKVLFTWEEVAAWIQPSLPSPPTPKVGGMTVELPLKTIAPIFMSHHRAGAQKRVAVDETIPDLFNGGTGNATGHGADSIGAVPSSAAPVAQSPAPPARQTVPASAPAPAPAPAPRRQQPAPAPVAKTETQTASPHDSVSVEQVVGANGNRYNAKDIVANASRLPGVSGALLAMSDGLLVTSHTPPSVKAETIAAFLPQMFGRMNQYTKELTLGPLQQLTLGVEGGQWHVIKRDTIYFAVLGKHGDTLPCNLLAQIAAELSSQSK